MDFNYIKKILKISRLKNKVYLITFFSLVSSFFDIFSIGLILPIINFLFSNNVELNLNSHSLFYNFNLADVNLNIQILLILFLVGYFFKSFLTVFIYRYITKIKLNLQASLRLELIKKYDNLAFSFFLKKQSSEYIHNITSVVTVYSNVLMSFLRIISEVVIIIIILAYLSFINFKVIFTLFPFFLFLLLLYYFLLRKKTILIGKNINDDSKGIIQDIKDFITGFKEIKISNKSLYFINLIETKAKNLASNSIFYETILFIPRHLFEFTIIAALILSIYLNLEFFEKNKVDILASIAAYFYASLRLIPSLSLVSRMLTIMENGKVFSNNLYADLFENKIAESKFINKNSILDNGEWEFQSLKLKNIFFSYQNSNDILNNLSFEIKKRDSIFISGKSGGGKTTIFDIILGLYEPKSGEIQINDSNDKKQLQFLRNNTYYLSQNRFLFNDSIFKNIVIDNNVQDYHDLDQQDKNHFDSAISVSRVNEFADHKKHGMNFRIGEGGSKLSGGQRQRLMIARALFSNKQILIFDEATSEIDMFNETEIFKDILVKFSLKTLLVISHRETLNQFFKNTYVLENGKLQKKI